MIQHKKKHYEVVSAGPWQGVVPTDVPEQEPLHRWWGNQIPLGLVRQMTAFFEWSFKETGGESVCHLYYNEDTGEWKAAVLPQRGYTGMAVSLLPDHPGRLEVVEALGRGFEPAGSGHHHCQGSAFQSGTDHADEKDVFGLHFTVGGIGKDRYSLDARCSFKKFFTAAVLSDWIEMPEALEEMDLPVGVAGPILEHIICTPQDVLFPEVWKANVIKAEPPKVQWSPWANKAIHEHYQGGWKIPQRGEVPQGDLYGGANAGKTVAGEEPRLTLEQSLDEFAQMYGYDAESLADHVKEYARDDVLAGLLEVAADAGVPLGEVLRACDKLADKKWDQEMEGRLKQLEAEGGKLLGDDYHGQF